MRLSLPSGFVGLLAAVLVASPARAVIPYAPVPAPGPPVVGPGVSPPPAVYGKEYSHDRDLSVFGPVADPEQVIAWDGLGGTADSIDYSFTRPSWPIDQDVDALANSRDALFDETIRDESHLVFSHDDMIAAYGVFAGGPVLVPVPSGGPIFLSNGNVIGGAGEVSVELSGVFAPPSFQTVWAKQPEVNGMPLPRDVDGLEVWGPEPRGGGEPGLPVVSDADKYSLDVDFPSGVSVWNASGTPYIGHPTIVGAVMSLLGPMPPSAFSLRDENQGPQAINLDALMVSDTIEDKDFFHQDVAAGGGGGVDKLVDQNGEPFEPFGPDGVMRGDSIIFSIRQIIDPADPDGYYATGSELFVLDSLGGVSFLAHGGHLWDHAYSLAALAFVGVDGQQNDFHAIIDINAIEAIGEDVISPVVPLPGDFNGDDVVDAIDYAVWRENLGTGFVLAGNGDEAGASAGIVDTADFKLWVDNYGAVAPGAIATATATPEPSAALLVLLAMTLGRTTRRRN